MKISRKIIIPVLIIAFLFVGIKFLTLMKENLKLQKEILQMQEGAATGSVPVGESENTAETTVKAEEAASNQTSSQTQENSDNQTTENSTTQDASAANDSTIRDTETALVDLIVAYNKGVAQAVNYNDFSIIEPYLINNSSLYNDQKKLVNNAYNKGIREEWVDTQLISYEYIASLNLYKLEVFEEYNLTYSNGTTKNLKSTYIYTASLEPQIGLSKIEAVNNQASSTEASNEASQQSTPTFTTDDTNTSSNDDIVTIGKYQYMIIDNENYIPAGDLLFFDIKRRLFDPGVYNIEFKMANIDDTKVSLWLDDFAIRKANGNTIKSGYIGSKGGFLDSLGIWDLSIIELYTNDIGEVSLYLNAGDVSPIGYTLYYDYMGRLIPICDIK